MKTLTSRLTGLLWAGVLLALVLPTPLFAQAVLPQHPNAIYSGAGATRTIQPYEVGGTFLFDRAAGIVYTLPPPVPGITVDFVATVSVTTNAYTVITHAATVFIVGTIGNIASANTAFACNGTSHVKVTSNGSTTGGVLGGRLHFVAISSTLWHVSGTLVGSSTGATACST